MLTQISRAIHDVLNSEDDLSIMRITENPSTGSGTVDPEDLPPSKPKYDLEMLFENYLMQIEWISSEVQERLDEITNTEGKMDNRIDERWLMLLFCTTQRTWSCNSICFGIEFSDMNCF